jgi:hypothetical protein
VGRAGWRAGVEVASGKPLVGKGVAGEGSGKGVATGTAGVGKGEMGGGVGEGEAKIWTCTAKLRAAVGVAVGSPGKIEVVLLQAKASKARLTIRIAGRVE